MISQIAASVAYDTKRSLHSQYRLRTLRAWVLAGLAVGVVAAWVAVRF